MGLFSWLENIFFSKEEKKKLDKQLSEEEIQKESEEYWKKRKLKEDREKSERLSYEKVEKEREELQKKWREEEQTPNKYKKLIQDLETNKSKIIKEKEEREIKDLGIGKGGYWIQIDKKLFLFDKEGYNLFKKEFNGGKDFVITIEYSRKDYYLARENIHTKNRIFSQVSYE